MTGELVSRFSAGRQDTIGLVQTRIRATSTEVRSAVSALTVAPPYGTSHEGFQAGRVSTWNQEQHRADAVLSAAQESQPPVAAQRRWLYIIPVSLVAVLAAAMLTVRLVHSAGPTIRAAPDDLLPGGPMPLPASCTMTDHPSFFEVYCTAFRGYLVRYTYNTRDRVISHTSYPLENVTAGDLILAWGAPDSYLYHYSHGIVQVFWGAKSALLSSLRASSPVVLVSHYLNPASLPAPRFAWRGFISPENADRPAGADSTAIPLSVQK